jgi:hypothetical protein
MGACGVMIIVLTSFHGVMVTVLTRFLVVVLIFLTSFQGEIELYF